MAVTYEQVKEHMLRYHRNNAHFSRHQPDDPDHLAVVAMGAEAAPFLFQLMRDHRFEACHFSFNIIPLLIEPPEHIVRRLKTEAMGRVSKMEEIYQQWGREIGAIE
jgi:hypothetical protein